ncbi:MAG: S24/S26 family peptidase [Clostridia bacterium]|nr:S24/S26 family peptidase [Clostridia bacterium]
METVEKLKIEDVLREKGVYVGPTVGVSMLPMLKSRRDTVVIRPKTERLKRLDVALYRRGEAYVLHRVLAREEGGYLIRGDNCYSDEHIPEDDVFGVLTEFFRKGKHILCTDKKYLKYAEKRIKTYKTRRFFVIFKGKIKGAIRKIVRIFIRKKKSVR